MPSFDLSHDSYCVPLDEGSDAQLDQPAEVVGVDIPGSPFDDQEVPVPDEEDNSYDAPECSKSALSVGEFAVRASEQPDDPTIQDEDSQVTVPDEVAPSDCRSVVNPSESLSDEGDTQTASQGQTYDEDPSDVHTDSELPHAIQNYLDEPRQGFLELDDPVRIPTSDGDMMFTLSDTSWQTNSTVDEYRAGAFGDEYDEQLEFVDGCLVAHAVPAADRSLVVAGGEREVFAPGNRVLDPAGGEALGALGFGRDHPDAVIVVVDKGYMVERDIDLNVPGVHLTRGDWNHLNFPDGSMDAIIMKDGPFMHEEDLTGVTAEISRVAAPGAILRFDVDETYDITARDPCVRHDTIMRLLQAQGWKVTTRRGTVIGRMQKSTDSD